MTANGDRDEQHPRRLIEAGAEVANGLAADVVGGFAAAGAGFLVAGPVGMMAAAVVAPVVTKVLQAALDHRQRHLSPREAERITAFLMYAKERIGKNLADGQRLREDGWFHPTRPGGRTAADEVADATARTVREQAQERKIQYLGNLIGNLAFDDEVDAVTAHRAMKTAEELTYTQYQLLALYYRHPDLLAKFPKNSNAEMSWEVDSVYGELDDIGWGKRELILPTGQDVLGPASDRKLTPRGELLAKLLSLDEIPVIDLNEVVAPLLAGAAAVSAAAES